MLVPHDITQRSCWRENVGRLHLPKHVPFDRLRKEHACGEQCGSLQTEKPHDEEGAAYNLSDFSQSTLRIGTARECAYRIRRGGPFLLQVEESSSRQGIS